MQFTCSCCRESHDLSQISFGADAPVQWRLLTEAERARSELGQEQCVIESDEGRHFFVRACLEIPIQGVDDAFTWGVWTSLSEASFLEMSDHWEDPDRTRLGPYFGWLSTNVPEYPDSVFLRSRVHQRPVGFRPLIELDPSDHPLAVHQRQGIDATQLQAIVRRLLHPLD
jgi:hypothetical protein